MWRRWLVVLAAGCGGGHAAKPPGGGSDATTPIDVSDGTDADLSCPTPGTIPPLHAELLVSGMVQPIYVTQPPGSTDLYVVEKPGKIEIVRAGALLPAPFLDVTGVVNIPDPSSEAGLLGLAFAADYAASGRLFVFESLKTPDRAAVVEYQRSADPDVATPTPVAELISWPHGGYNSLGGTIEFGTDGALWISSGDAAAVPSQAPDTTSRLGKLLRIDVDHPQTPPAGNLGGAADPFVWDYGLRNPYRFSFDRQTHDLYVADAGDQLYEEVDVEAPGAGGHDYGWDRMEGMHCHDGTTSCGAAGTLPVYERPHDTGYSVIIGGVVYRGGAMPCLRGRYIFGIHGTGHILSWVWSGGAVTSETELTDMMMANLTSIVSFGQDQAGELYMTTLGGELYAIVPGT